MNRKPMWARQLRRASGVAVVAASTIALGLPLSGVASAAATAISAQPDQPNYAVGETAQIDVNVTGSPTSLQVTVLNGPDQSYPAPAGTCTSTPGSTSPSGFNYNYTCTVQNGGTAGTDSVRVYDATGANAPNFDAGDQFGDTSVTFAAAPYALTLQPSTHSEQANVCTTYTVTATDQQGRAAADYPITITATENTGSSTGTPLSFCNVTGGQTPAGQSNTSAATTPATNPASNTDTLTGTVTTDGTGKAVFGLESSQAGTVSITAQYQNGARATATDTVVGGQTGNDAVKNLNVQPTQANGYTGATENFTVTALDANGNPVSGATVSEEVTSGPDQAAYTPTGAGAVNCPGTTAAGTGQVTCSITNSSGNPGTDNVTFYVNYTTGATNGPDSGEPTATATATFTAPPAFSAANSTVTCQDQTTANGQAGANCTVPTSQKSITFTATINDANGKPVQGVVVDWTTGGSASAANATPRSGTSTTDANGQATYTVTDSAPANGDTVSATASVAGTTIGTATATYQTAAATNFTLTPPDQTVQNGGTVTVTATTTDQFGNPVSGDQITWSVNGRNNGKTGTVTTGANGTATITYTDTGTTGTTDTITATSTKTGTQATAKVHYTTGSTTASTVTVATNGVTADNPAGTPNGTCPTTTAGSNTNPNTNGDVEFNNASIPVCAHVVNSTGETLAGKSVTFTVDKGFVTSTNNQAPATDTQSVTVATDANGNAYAWVYSHTSGTQTVTATADSATGSGTVNWASGNARNVALTPANPTITPGQSQKFTATVTDLYGNPVQGVFVNFSQSGPGSITGTSTTSGNTDANGQISVTLTTQPSDNGPGTVTADINPFGGAGAECNQQAGTPPGSTTAGNCTATDNYTVSAQNLASNVNLAPASATVTGGHSKKFTATVTDGNGNPVSGVAVHFAKSGPGSLSTTSANTGANGTAIVTLATSKRSHGTGTIVATINGTNTSCGTAGSTCSATSTYTVKPVRKAIKVGLSLWSPKAHHANVIVRGPAADRGARVTVVTKDNGKTRRFHGKLDKKGQLRKSFWEPAGSTVSAQAHVKAHGIYKSGSSPVKTKHVKG